MVFTFAPIWNLTFFFISEFNLLTTNILGLITVTLLRCLHLPHWVRSNSLEAEPEAGILVQVIWEGRALRGGRLGDEEQGRESREDRFQLERSLCGRLELTLMLTATPGSHCSRL